MKCAKCGYELRKQIEVMSIKQRRDFYFAFWLVVGVSILMALVIPSLWLVSLIFLLCLPLTYVLDLCVAWHWHFMGAPQSYAFWHEVIAGYIVFALVSFPSMLTMLMWDSIFTILFMAVLLTRARKHRKWLKTRIGGKK